MRGDSYLFQELVGSTPRQLLFDLFGSVLRLSSTKSQLTSRTTTVTIGSMRPTLWVISLKRTNLCLSLNELSNEEEAEYFDCLMRLIKHHQFH